MAGGGYFWAGLLSMVAVFPAVGAAAEPATPAAAEVIFLDYEAPAECPSRDGFFDQVRAFTPRVALATQPGVQRLFKVRVHRVKHKVVGSLEILNVGETAQREVSAATCDEVADALALAAALAIDPTLVGAPAPAQEPEPPTAAKPTPAKPVPAPPPPPPRAQNVEPVPSKPTGAEPAAAVSLGAEALVVWGLLPRAAYGAGIDVEYGLNDVDRSLPSIVIGAGYVSHGAIVKQGATVNFSALSLETEACWKMVTVAPASFDLCPVVQLGRLQSALEAPASKSSGSRGWATVGVASRARVALGRAVSLELGVALQAHLIRQRIVVVGFEPNEPTEELLTHETTGAMASVAAGLAYRF